MALTRPFHNQFEVAFSFAGEQRALVSAMATELERVLGVGTVFYDEWFEAHIAGKDCDLTLQEIYFKRANLVVPCVSQNYASKLWPQIEYDAIRALT